MPKSQRDGHSTLARSLPVTVPAFPTMIRRTVQDQDDDQVKLYVFLTTNNCNILYYKSAIIFCYFHLTRFCCYHSIDVRSRFDISMYMLQERNIITVAR